MRSVVERSAPLQVAQLAERSDAAPAQCGQKGHEDFAGHPRIAFRRVAPIDGHLQVAGDALQAGVAESERANETAGIERGPSDGGSPDSREHREVEPDVVTDDDAAGTHGIEPGQHVRDRWRARHGLVVDPVNRRGLPEEWDTRD